MTKASRRENKKQRVERLAKSALLNGKTASPEQTSESLTIFGDNVVLPMTLVLAAVTVGLYCRVARYPFVNFDDGPYVFENPHVTAGLTLKTVKWAFSSMAAGNWHPLTWISHALDWQLFGIAAGGHHLTSLLLHVTNASLLFAIWFRVTGAKWRSGMVASLFAIHPLNVESVAWIAERKNLLCTLFFLLALAAYGWYARKPGIWRYLLVAGFFVLGLASKPMVIILPFVLVLLDVWPLGRIAGWSTPSEAWRVPQSPPWKLAAEKLPLLLLSFASSVITFVAQRKEGAVAQVAGWPLSWRIENGIHSYAMYLWKGFFPYGLAAFYPGTALTWWEIAWALLILGGIGWLIWKFHKGRPWLMVGSLWFLGTLVPVIGIVQVGSQAMADRYAYIPMIGVFVVAVWGFSEVFERMSIQTPVRWSAAAIVLLVLGGLTWRQVGYWKNSYDLWTHALEVTRSNFLSEGNLGIALLDMGREDEAYTHFQRVLVTAPYDPVALLNIGVYLGKRNQPQEAIAAFERLLRVSSNPTDVIGAYRGLGVANAEMGDQERARSYLLRALKMEPSDRERSVDMYNLTLVEAQKLTEMMKRSVIEHPTAEGYLQLGEMLQQKQRFPDAQEAYEKALKLDPHLAAAKQALRYLKDRQEVRN